MSFNEKKSMVSTIVVTTILDLVPRGTGRGAGAYTVYPLPFVRLTSTVQRLVVHRLLFMVQSTYDCLQNVDAVPPLPLSKENMEGRITLRGARGDESKNSRKVATRAPNEL